MSKNVKQFSKRKKDKMSVIKNNLYMLKHMFKASPLGVVLSLVYFFLWRGIGLFYSIVLMRYLMQALETGADFVGVVKLRTEFSKAGLSICMLLKCL